MTESMKDDLLRRAHRLIQRSIGAGYATSFEWLRDYEEAMRPQYDTAPDTEHGMSTQELTELFPKVFKPEPTDTTAGNDRYERNATTGNLESE